jgi:hypothetical protein
MKYISFLLPSSFDYHVKLSFVFGDKQNLVLQLDACDKFVKVISSKYVD